MLIFLHIPFDSRRSLGFSRGVLWSRGRRRSGEIYCSSLQITMTMMMILILMILMVMLRAKLINLWLSKASGHVELLELSGNNANQEKSKFGDRFKDCFDPMHCEQCIVHSAQCRWREDWIGIHLSAGSNEFQVWVVLWQFLERAHWSWWTHHVRGLNPLILVDLGWSWLIFVDIGWSWLILVDLGRSLLVLVDIGWSWLI